MTSVSTNGLDGKRFALVTAGHHFLLSAVPFREPESRDLLEEFIHTAERIALPSADLDAVLIRCLAVLNDHTGGRLPSLVDRYVSNEPHSTRGLAHFAACVSDIIRYRGITDGVVQQAIELVSSRYADPATTQQAIARALELRMSTLCVAFRRQTGLTLGQHLRSVRLDAAANLLVTTSRSIKEIWVHVGYNHPSNFAHDFKQRFQVSPREYRARSIRPVAQKLSGGIKRPRMDPGVVHGAGEGQQVLIVDDDPWMARMISEHLCDEGYSVSVGANGAAGLREAEHSCPAVILLDYRLPDMDGVAFLTALRARASIRPPAVALFTADWNVFDRADEVHALGAMIASKLCDLDQIRQLILFLCAGPEMADEERSVFASSDVDR